MTFSPLDLLQANRRAAIGLMFSDVMFEVGMGTTPERCAAPCRCATNACA
jgi:hypothetical protein